MADIRQLLTMIQELRDYMHDLIDKRKDVLDPEVLAASKMLDALLNEYEKLIREKEVK